MPYLVIYNEQAGSSSSHQLQQIEAFFRSRNLQAVIHSIGKDGSFVHRNPGDYERILSVGGDGTLKEVANWIIRSGSKTPLAVIPKGTGNLFAGALEIPTAVQDALKLAVTGAVQAIDAGLINDREYFLLAAGVGLDARVIRQTTRPMKRFFGFLAYVFTSIEAVLRLSSNKIFIKSEEFEGSVRAQSVVATNIDTFFKMKLHPDAKMNDGHMVVSIFKPLSIFDIITIVRKILRGDYARDWRFYSFRTKRVYILPFNKRTPRQIDGEVSYLPYFDIKVMAQALNIVTNKKL